VTTDSLDCGRERFASAHRLEQQERSASAFGQNLPLGATAAKNRAKSQAVVSAFTVDGFPLSTARRGLRAGAPETRN
jgi:hypothetical protein